ncbi:MAG: M48 family metallopeptidase [Spirosomataceae bacterium]
MNLPFYPQSPQIADYSFLNPSPQFVAKVRSTVTGIFLFFIFYLLLILFAIGLLYCCGLAAMWMLALSINKITIVLGVGLICLGLMFFVFLFKFIFSIKKDENNQRVEITRNQHPRLFEFIDQLTEDVQAPKPQRIFLTPEVNAAVFYNSSFWSLFLPVRKNLQIGLGLVNCVNLSEFKAIMAHEFGHFSQRSMKVGSYVYMVNRVIYNLVYEYDSWDRMLDEWAASNSFWSIFAKLTRGLVNLVRGLLRKAYELLNERYMGLSREMEYNADLVAVSAVGNEASISALRRISFGDIAYQQTLEHLNSLVSESKRSDNIYPFQSALLTRLANEMNIELSHDLPIMTEDVQKKMTPPHRVYYKNQWASHPDQTERENNINTVQIKAEFREDSPWQLFNEVEKWQKTLTEKLYEGVPAQENSQWSFVEKNDFLQHIEDSEARAKLPEQYQGFYTRRWLNDFNPKELSEQPGIYPSFDEIFTTKNRQLIDKLFINREDYETLISIQNKSIKVKTFDFDGQKYETEDIDTVLSALKVEMNQQESLYQNLEEKAFLWHYGQAKKQGREAEVLERYQTYFKLGKEADKYQLLFQEYHELIIQIQKAAQEDGSLGKFLLSEIDRLNLEIQEAYKESNQFSIPEKIGTVDLSKGIAPFLLSEKPKTVYGDPFVWDNLLKLYEQLEIIRNQSVRIQLLYLDDLIRWQAIFT